MKRSAGSFALLALSAAVSCAPGLRPALAGTAPTILDGRPIGVPVAPGAPAPQAPVAAPPRVTRLSPQSVPSSRSFVLTSVTITGAESLPAAELRSTWVALRGTRITVGDVRGIADRVAALCRRHDDAIFRVTIPTQQFTGAVRIDLIVGHVENVAIEGDTKNADLWRLRAYAAAIAADRPLRQATLERYVLLMNAIPGLTVGSRFRPLPSRPDGVELVLTIRRTRFEYGFGFDNAGQPVLGRTEVEANVAVNDLFGEGDRTQFTFGLPIDVNQFQYFALNHVEPLGRDGATITLDAADLLTHPTHDSVAGNATIVGATVAMPLVERVHQTLLGSVGFDAIDSNSALVGLTISDERTRTLRFRLQGAADQWLDGVSAFDLVLSHGIGVAGARRGSIVYGGPEFTKLTLRLSREQHLPLGLVLRARGFGQYAAERLPGSEQFAFGGFDFGQAFQEVTLTGDRALAGALELAHALPAFTTTRWTSGTEAFVLADAGEVWNAPNPFAPDTDRGASVGFGVRTKLLGKVTVQAEAADAVVRPTSVGSDAGWRAVLGLTGAF